MASNYNYEIIILRVSHLISFKLIYRFGYFVLKLSAYGALCAIRSNSLSVTFTLLEVNLLLQHKLDQRETRERNAKPHARCLPKKLK